jgi:transcriptional regulator with XRE-family HTH domain
VATVIEPFYLELGRRIHTARERAGLTQQQLGSLLAPPVTRASIANIESGKQRVLCHTLVGIGQALAVPPSSLLEAPTTAERPAEPDITAELTRKLGRTTTMHVLKSIGAVAKRRP